MLIIILPNFLYGNISSLWGELKPGPYAVGFRLIEEIDFSRYYPSLSEGGMRNGRPVRIYFWYPAKKAEESPLGFETFVRYGAEDFDLLEDGQPLTITSPPMPVQMVAGIPQEKLKRLLNTETASIIDAQVAEGSFPLLVLGQGLYYESPLTHLVLCEYLASHGFCVVTCPLKGTLYRLVNLSVRDLETQVRDMEFAMSIVRRNGFVHPERLGVIGYDMGGMAGMILSMRNPDVDGFFSLDAGILTGHGSGLPNDHPNYDIERFTIPWMHMTQGRFLDLSEGARPTAMDIRFYGDNILAGINTQSHGEFTSYSMFGIENPVMAYWRGVSENPNKIYEAACHNALLFFDGYLKDDQSAVTGLYQLSASDNTEGIITSVKHRKKLTPSMTETGLIHRIITEGKTARQHIETVRKSVSDSVLFQENVLNWLGYHFLYWWGRPTDAVFVFELMTDVYPQSANAFDSLGESYLRNGDTEKAKIAYTRSVELNPENENAKAMLQRLNQDE